MIKRSEKLAFMQVTEDGNEVYRRMTEFTELSVSKNPKEYSRKYVDESSERNAVIGYSPAISYKMDYDPENSVHKEFAQIADRELIGEDAVKNIVIVDLTTANSNGIASAVKRAFSIIPASEGDDSDTYTLSGNMKASGEIVFGEAESSDDWQTITFTEAE
ncbi:MAG TPA: hypothetical protein DCO93_05400 [Clostridiales bacterium]|nr:hypothetical protein [Clostridiales bacterium]